MPRVGTMLHLHNDKPYHEGPSVSVKPSQYQASRHYGTLSQQMSLLCDMMHVA
jgi:hypothetical protein